MGKRLYVGNLSYDVAESALRELFAACGEVDDIAIVTDRPSGRPRGYAFVTMRTTAEAERAVDALDGKAFEARALHVVVDDPDPDGAPPTRIARAIRRTLGYVRYARDIVGASAVSLFLFDEDSGELRGVVAEWDWTRSSFPARLADWPTVDAALTTRDTRPMTRGNASGPEAGWFEARGIVRAFCVPLCDGPRRLGVLFFDFDAKADESADGDGVASTRGEVAAQHITFLNDVGDRCARAIAREGRGSIHPPAPPTPPTP